MIIVSYNIIGGGSLVKKRRIWHTLLSSKADVCLIQESKFIDVDSSKIRSLWYNNGISWSSSVSSGHSAGLIILWNSSSFKLLASVKVGSFLEICLDWKGQFLGIGASGGISTIFSIWRRGRAKLLLI